MPFYVALEVKDSPLEGKGLFAAEDIPAGTLYWSLVPLPGKQTVKVRGYEAKENVVMTEEMVDDAKANWPKEEYVGLLQGGFPLVPHNRFCHLRDGGQFTNHSDDPNCGGDWTDSIDTECAFSIKDIKAGDEILENYGTFHDAKLPWVEKHSAPTEFKGTCPICKHHLVVEQLLAPFVTPPIT